MRIMEDRHGFKASMRAYRQKFADWKVRKYRRHSSTLSTPSSSGASNSRAPMGQSFDNGGYRQDQDDQYLSPNQYRASHGSGWPTTRSYSTTTSPTDISVLSISTPLTDSGQASFTSVYPSHTRSPSFSGQLSPIPHQSLGQWGTASGTGTGHGYGVLASPVSMATTASPYVSLSSRCREHELIPKKAVSNRIVPQVSSLSTSRVSTPPRHMGKTQASRVLSTPPLAMASHEITLVRRGSTVRLSARQHPGTS
jgi:hypothetical protein